MLLHSYSRVLKGHGESQAASRQCSLGLTWLSVAIGSLSLSDSSELSESSSCFLVLLTVLSWTGGVIAAFPGVEAAFFPEDTVVGAGEALAWVAFTEGFTWTRKKIRKGMISLL